MLGDDATAYFVCPTDAILLLSTDITLFNIKQHLWYSSAVEAENVSLFVWSEEKYKKCQLENALSLFPFHFPPSKCQFSSERTLNKRI